MKKIAYILGAVVLATGSVSAVTAFADSATVNTLGTSLVSDAKAAEASARAAGNTNDNSIIAAISAQVENDIEAAVAAGDSSADIQAAMNLAMNTPGLSADVANALGAVNGQLASLESSKPGGVSPGTGGGSGNATPPTPPPPAAAGSGYVQ